MRLRCLMCLAILVLAIPAIAAEETKPLEETAALRIKVLMLERTLIQERISRLQFQAQQDFQEKGKALDAAVEAAAKEAGLDLKDGWQPDVESRVWRKGK